ncbi:MAG: TrmB family transcriptional regulator [Nitrososphaerota archaeon]|jgi:sugar-specific transcriptional regulator TrmB|nr:TrmB family transcriptional regulator [Nitrososphaerota archaeon]
MTANEETRSTLREMGLNAYEIDAYLVLLDSGEMTAMEVSRHAGVPYSKMYEVLNSLKEKGWIKSGESRPFKYYPVPPLEAARSTKLRLEDKYVCWESTISKTLQPLYEKRELVERPDMLILRGQQAVLTKLEEIFTKASVEIVVAAPEFAKPLITIAEPLLSSGLKKSVTIKLMATGKKEDWQFIKKHAGLGTLRIRDHMFGGGIIADGKEAMLFLGEDKPNLVIWSNHVGLVGFAREYFQFLWDSSETT